MKKKIKELIDKSNSILLLTHEAPDGDAVGSVLAIYHYLSSINKTVDMVVLDIPKVFSFLPAINNIVDSTNKEYDLGIVVDCASCERIGQKEDLLSKCKHTVTIDHHVSNTNFCDLNYVQGNVSSCCQVIYSLFKDWNIEITNEMGECLISGIITDTNGFGNNNVDSETFKIAFEFISLGVNVHDVYKKLLWIKTKPQYELMRIGMDRLEFFCDGKIAFTYILKSDFEKVGASNGEHEGIVDIGRNIEGVEISILVRQDNGWTVSLRSSGKFPVNTIASKIDGGGHFMAAGGKMDGSLEDIKSFLIDETKKVLL